MSAVCSNIQLKEADLRPDVPLPKDDVVQQKGARARTHEKPNSSESEIPQKKRRTRRGKSKRKHPYIKSARKSNKMIKPEAPHNSNQFLLEDHGVIEDLDENLKCQDQVSTSTVTRTRDSSFSVDSDGEFYSSPDDEEQFLIKDFVDQYESVQAEHLHSMTKAQLIEEYQQLENKVELLTKRLQKSEEKDEEDLESNKPELQREIERLKIENASLRRENELLRSKVVNCSDSEDSETDSSDSCSSTSSSSSNSTRPTSPVPEIDYKQTNGHTSPPTSVKPV